MFILGLFIGFALGFMLASCLAVGARADGPRRDE